MPVFFIVVLYNKYLEDIRSLNVFLEFLNNHEGKVIVVDNSKEDYYSKNVYFSDQRVVYICNYGNIGLSKSYNKAIKSIDLKEYCIMLSDDDTYFSADYIQRAYNCIEKKDSLLVAGVVKTLDNVVMSPVANNPVLGRQKVFINIPGHYRNIFAINSGLFIHSTILNDGLLFNENLFVDMIDYCYMDQLIEKGLNDFIVVDGRIEQDFSGNNQIDIDSLNKRFSIFKKDFRVYCRDTNKKWIYKTVVYYKRLVHVTVIKNRIMLKAFFGG